VEELFTDSAQCMVSFMWNLKHDFPRFYGHVLPEHRNANGMPL